MRLALITSSYPRTADESANAGVFVRDVAGLLHSKGHHVTVVTPQDVRGVTDPWEHLQIPWPGDAGSLSHVDASTIGGKARLATLMANGVVSVARSQRRTRFDHVIAMWAVPSGLLALVPRLVWRVPYSVWALGSDIWRIDDYPAGRFLLRQVLRRATRVYADGLQLAEDTNAAGATDTQFLASARHLQPPPPWSGSGEPRFTMTAIGRFHEHKGMDVLVEAFAGLAPEIREVSRLRVHGAGPDGDLLTRLAQENGLTSQELSIGGPVSGEGLQELFATSDLAIIPSRQESIPLILSDIARVGCPLLCTDAGDMGRLVVAHDAGSVVPAGDAVALAQAMTTAIDRGALPAPEGLRSLAEELDIKRSVDRLLADIGGG